MEGPFPLRLWRYFNEGINQFGDSRLAVIAKLGPPKQTNTGEELGRTKMLSPEEARYLRGHGANIQNEITEFVYDGLTMRILKVNSPPYREFIYDVTVTSHRYKMPGHLNVGSKRQDVLRLLGNPAQSNDRGDIFDVTPVDYFGEQVGGYEHAIIFSYRGDAVCQIRFWLTID